MRRGPCRQGREWVGAVQAPPPPAPARKERLATLVAARGSEVIPRNWPEISSIASAGYCPWATRASRAAPDRLRKGGTVAAVGGDAVERGVSSVE